VSVFLTKQVEKDILYGDATITVYEGFVSVDVAGHYMPDLPKFGPRFNAYGFLVLNPTTCQILAHQRMVVVDPEVNTWAGTLELGTPPHGFPGGLVVVYPLEPTGAFTVTPVLVGTLPPIGADPMVASASG